LFFSLKLTSIKIDLSKEVTKVIITSLHRVLDVLNLCCHKIDISGIGLFFHRIFFLFVAYD